MKLLPIAFLSVFGVLCVAAVATSTTLHTADAVSVQVPSAPAPARL